MIGERFQLFGLFLDFVLGVSTEIDQHVLRKLFRVRTNGQFTLPAFSYRNSHYSHGSKREGRSIVLVCVIGTDLIPVINR